MGTSRVNQISRHFGTNEPGNEPAESIREKGTGGREERKEAERFFPFSLFDTRGASPSSIPSSFLISIFPEISKAFLLFPFIPFLCFLIPSPRHSRRSYPLIHCIPYWPSVPVASFSVLANNNAFL